MCRTITRCYGGYRRSRSCGIEIFGSRYCERCCGGVGDGEVDIVGCVLRIGGVREVGECEDEEDERLQMGEGELHSGL